MVQDYPYHSPTVRFVTSIFHPNVDTQVRRRRRYAVALVPMGSLLTFGSEVQGNICLDILKEKWSAAYSVRTILLSIQVGLVHDVDVILLLLRCVRPHARMCNAFLLLRRAYSASRTMSHPSMCTLLSFGAIRRLSGLWSLHTIQ